MYRYSYALEKFGRAIYSLATGKDEIRVRLKSVFSGDLAVITAEHLPDSLHGDYRAIIESSTKYDEAYPGQKKTFSSTDGRFDHLVPTKAEATLRRVQREAGVDIAQKIFHMWEVLDEESKSSKNT